MDTKTELRTLRLFIDGKWTDARGGFTFDDFNPLDDSLYARVAKGSGNDIRDAIAAAKSAFSSYKETTPTERERWLLRVAELMEERQKELIDCLIDEIGSPFHSNFVHNLFPCQCRKLTSENSTCHYRA